MDITKTKVINLKKSRILILARWLLSQNRLRLTLSSGFWCTSWHSWVLDTGSMRDGVQERVPDSLSLEGPGGPRSADSLGPHGPSQHQLTGITSVKLF